MESRGLRVALLVSGHPRTWKRNAIWIDTYLRPMFKEVDVYAHLWDTVDAPSSWKGISAHPSIPTPTDEIFDAIKPKMLQVQSMDTAPIYDSVLEDRWPTSPGRPKHIMGQWYGMKRAWEMMECTKENYDIVIRHRLDVTATFKLSPQYKKAVVIGKRHSKWVRQTNGKAICDCHAYGCMEVMKAYYQIYQFRSMLLTPRICCRKLAGKERLVPEFAMQYYLNHRGTPYFEDNQYCRKILRMDGSHIQL